MVYFPHHVNGGYLKNIIHIIFKVPLVEVLALKCWVCLKCTRGNTGVSMCMVYYLEYFVRFIDVVSPLWLLLLFTLLFTAAVLRGYFRSHSGILLELPSLLCSGWHTHVHHTYVHTRIPTRTTQFVAFTHRPFCCCIMHGCYKFLVKA